MDRLREQKLIDIMFEIAMTLHGNPPWAKNMDRDQLAQWIRHQLDQCGFTTIPMGISWAVLVDPIVRESYDAYQNKISIEIIEPERID